MEKNNRICIRVYFIATEDEERYLKSTNSFFSWKREMSKKLWNDLSQCGLVHQVWQFGTIGYSMCGLQWDVNSKEGENRNEVICKLGKLCQKWPLQYYDPLLEMEARRGVIVEIVAITENTPSLKLNYNGGVEKLLNYDDKENWLGLQLGGDILGFDGKKMFVRLPFHKLTDLEKYCDNHHLKFEVVLDGNKN
ncbi:MAG: hypothetical protein A3I89_01040 [Candidatus Harrisonbacteria bacterium RIFCSPLOWO2_02_FULL_41_11]|uniref:Uncharacterized protein n=1 Tax=Candidatus Harrisonbacteria bacterium RIFCSPHIGHO2_02_FULL_42_16 TaxID=1798404 RepID=A0A1G1ZGX3_9BACT|nr:MAG: hypothetical protein A3B92_03825 [Candidatus Harrisonbacteria bacterium RIFCSPHIGHO2_02_FULL_42_16]OGY66995.1 MAG: hypothetical protein A3I89_01040 [Candidatus Harrisonbacteria bacterium RIFCSPLOWO2_02_FULL_41_11]